MGYSICLGGQKKSEFAGMGLKISRGEYIMCIEDDVGEAFA